MTPVHDLFESHLNVAGLQRSMSFFGQTLGLELAEVFWDRRVALFSTSPPICGSFLILRAFSVPEGISVPGPKYYSYEKTTLNRCIDDRRSMVEGQKIRRKYQ